MTSARVTTLGMKKKKGKARASHKRGAVRWQLSLKSVSWSMSYNLRIFQNVVFPRQIMVKAIGTFEKVMHEKVIYSFSTLILSLNQSNPTLAHLSLISSFILNQLTKVFRYNIMTVSISIEYIFQLSLVNYTIDEAIFTVTLAADSWPMSFCLEWCTVEEGIIDWSIGSWISLWLIALFMCIFQAEYTCTCSSTKSPLYLFRFQKSKRLKIRSNCIFLGAPSVAPRCRHGDRSCCPESALDVDDNRWHTSDGQPVYRQAHDPIKSAQCLHSDATWTKSRIGCIWS